MDSPGGLFVRCRGAGSESATSRRFFSPRLLNDWLSKRTEVQAPAIRSHIPSATAASFAVCRSIPDKSAGFIFSPLSKLKLLVTCCLVDRSDKDTTVFQEPDSMATDSLWP